MAETGSIKGVDLDPVGSTGELPVRLTETARRMFGAQLPHAERYAAILATEGITRGLLGPREASRLWDRHLLNCVAVAELISRDNKVIDVGSGAGLPGIALAIARPELYMTLFEPLLRRHAFLQDVSRNLELPQIQVLRRRAKTSSADISAHIVTARAVAPLERLVGWCLPLLRRGGRLLAIKGRNAEEELRAAGTALREHRVSAARVVRCGEGILDSPTVVIELTK